MNCKQKKGRGLGLCSGGLDSTLAGVLLKRQGLEVEWITFETPFFGAQKALKASRLNGIPLTVKAITPVYLEMLKNPPCGYGKFMNPCLDCHTLMFRLAGEEMRARGFDFLFSGEVLGQRPMSQTRPSLRYVEKNSGFDGYILRPLSARCLPETIPEREGLVDREQLLDISGRSRKRQMQLAAEWGVHDYPAPAGGCLLTDKGYSARLKDLFAHQAEVAERDLQLLKHGRHFRLANGAKVIVGRTQADNARIEALHEPAATRLVRVQGYPGPLVLIARDADPATITIAAAICAGYSKAPAAAPVSVAVDEGGDGTTVRVVAVAPGDVKHLMV